jgi:hypothetical protein
MVILWSMGKRESEKKKRDPEYKTNYIPLVITIFIWIIVIYLIFLLVPGMVQRSKEFRFQQNELMIDNLVKGGMNRNNARTQVIQQRQAEAALAAQQKSAETQARATRRAADRQASATDRQTNALLQAFNKK